MEWPAQVQALTSVAALMATIFGFWFVSRQIKLVRRTLDAQANVVLSEQSLAILAFIAANPSTYAYLYNGKILAPNDPNEVAVKCVCEMVANYCDMVVAVLPDLRADVAARWTNFIVDTAASSPALCQHLRDHPLWYSTDLFKTLGVESI